MPKPISMRFIRSQIRARHYRLTKHATIARMRPSHAWNEEL